MINAIVAASQKGVIGIGNELPWRLPNDLKRFKELTAFNGVVMGRNTYESIASYAKGKEVLPGRFKYVITSREIVNIPYDTRAVMITEDPEKWLRAVAKNHDELFVIGGAQIYKMFNGMYDRVYKTVVNIDIDETQPNLSYDPIDLTDYIWCSSFTPFTDEKNIHPYEFHTWIKNEHNMEVDPRIGRPYRGHAQD